MQDKLGKLNSYGGWLRVTPKHWLVELTEEELEYIEKTKFQKIDEIFCKQCKVQLKEYHNIKNISENVKIIVKVRFCPKCKMVYNFQYDRVEEEEHNS